MNHLWSILRESEKWLAAQVDQRHEPPSPIISREAEAADHRRRQPNGTYLVAIFPKKSVLSLGKDDKRRTQTLRYVPFGASCRLPGTHDPPEPVASASPLTA